MSPIGQPPNSHGSQDSLSSTTPLLPVNTRTQEDFSSLLDTRDFSSQFAGIAERQRIEADTVRIARRYDALPKPGKSLKRAFLERCCFLPRDEHRLPSWVARLMAQSMDMDILALADDKQCLRRLRHEALRVLREELDGWARVDRHDIGTCASVLDQLLKEKQRLPRELRGPHRDAIEECELRLRTLGASLSNLPDGSYRSVDSDDTSSTRSREPAFNPCCR